MLKLELFDSGLDNVITEIKEDLYSVVGKSTSKKAKDDMIYKTIGALTAVYYTIGVHEVDDGDAVADESDK